MPLIYAHKKRKNRSQMAEKKEEPALQSKSLTDSDSSDDNVVNPRFKMSVEERQYNTIPGLAIGTCIALSYSRAQANPTVERAPPHQKVKVNKPCKSLLSISLVVHIVDFVALHGVGECCERCPWNRPGSYILLQ